MQPWYSEKQARISNYKISHVKFEGELDFSSRALKGKATLSIRVGAVNIVKGENANEFSLDAVNLEIERVTINQSAVSFQYDGTKLLLQRPPDRDNFSVTVAYRVEKPKRGLHFTVPDSDHPDALYQAWTQGGSENNRYWLPVYDYPNMKFTSEIILAVPHHHIVISNGSLVAETATKDGEKRIFHWLMDRPHSSYLIAFYVGEFEELEDSSNGVDLRYYFPKDRGEEARATFKDTPKMLRFFEQYTKVKYPLKVYSQTCIAGLRREGMENTGATRLTDWILHDGTLADELESDALISHELAHQWIGDLVSIKDWSDKWLSEGFATYLQSLHLRETKGEDEFSYDLIRKLDKYLDEASNRYIRPVKTNFYSLPEEMRDRHSYEKAALVLHALSSLVSETNFTSAIKVFLEKYKFANADCEDFRIAAEEAAGREDLRWFFDQWICSAGHPKIAVNYSHEAGSRRVQIEVLQVQGADNDQRLFRFPFRIILRKQGSTLDSRILWIENLSTSLVFLPSEQPGYLCFGNEILFPCEVATNEDAGMLTGKLLHDEHLACRVAAARTLGKLQKPEGEAVKVLGSLLQESDTFWGLAVECARALGSINDPTALAELLKASSIREPRVRREIATSLGHFQDNRAYKELKHIFEEDPSPFVRASAIESIGKLGASGSKDLLLTALRVPSKNDMIASSALVGMANSRSEDFIATLLQYAFPPTIDTLRIAATSSLWPFVGDAKVKDAIYRLAIDESSEVRAAVVSCVDKSKNLEYLALLEKISRRDIEGMVVRKAIDSTRKLSEKG